MEIKKIALITCLSLLIFSSLYSATYTTTAVAGTWDIGGSPGASDNIIVNHDWSGYGGFGTISNYSGTMTINNGGWLKVTGDFTNFSGNIDIKTGGTFYITGSVSTASEAFGGSIIVNGTWRVNGSFSNGFCTIAGSGYIRVDGVYSGGCNGSVTLPVELTSFNAEKNANRVDLFWTTASEINSHYYSINRSANGIDFISIGTLPAAGNSNTLLHYSFVDLNPLIGINYYQLTEYDFDGQLQNSKIETVSFLEEQSIITQVYPNPTIGDVSLHFNSLNAGTYYLTLTDALGSIIYSAQIPAVVGENKFLLSLMPYPDAQYFVNMVSPNGETSTISIVKK